MIPLRAADEEATFTQLCWQQPLAKHRLKKCQCPASKTPPPRSNVTKPSRAAQHRMSYRVTSQESCIQEPRRDDFEFPTLEKLEQGSRNIEPIAALVSTRLVLSRAALLLPTVAAASCRDYLFMLQ